MVATMTGPTKPLSGVSGGLRDGRRWLIVSGKLYVERQLIGVRMRRGIEGAVGVWGDYATNPASIRADTVDALVQKLVDGGPSDGQAHGR